MLMLLLINIFLLHPLIKKLLLVVTFSREKGPSPKSATKSIADEDRLVETPMTNAKRKRAPGKDQVCVLYTPSPVYLQKLVLIRHFPCSLIGVKWTVYLFFHSLVVLLY